MIKLQRQQIGSRLFRVPPDAKSSILTGIDGLTVVCKAVCQRKSTHWITEVTKNVLNSITRDDLYHPVSQTYPAIAPPLFPCRSVSLFQTDCRSEGSLAERSHVCRWTKEILCKSRQRTSYTLHRDPIATADWWRSDRPCDNRRTPRRCPPRNI